MHRAGSGGDDERAVGGDVDDLRIEGRLVRRADAHGAALVGMERAPLVAETFEAARVETFEDDRQVRGDAAEQAASRGQGGGALATSITGWSIPSRTLSGRR